MQHPLSCLTAVYYELYENEQMILKSITIIQISFFRLQNIHIS